MQDDDSLPAGATLSTSSLRISENGGSGTYTMVLDSQPTHTVRAIITNTVPGAATLDTTLLTFTTARWNIPQTVTVTANDEAGTHRNRSLALSPPFVLDRQRLQQPDL